jgi:HTH-type transcriptional regulator, quorum sensing regulator NprR
MIFLTTGEKIRSLRKKFGMRQQELEDENITRAFISMIETGKRGLSRETARHIAEKLNKKAEGLGASLNIDENYLMRTLAEDAEVYCLQKLNNTPTKDEIEVIVEVAKKYSLTRVEAQAFKTLGDYEFEGESYGTAFIKYIVALDLYKDTDDKRFIAYLYNKLGVCKFKQLEYIEANSFFDRGNYYAILYKDSIMEKNTIYNAARVFKKLEKYDEALKYTQRYLELCDKEEDFKDYVYASVLKANCYRHKKNKDKAINILRKLMDELSELNCELSWYVYNSMGEIYLDENSLESSLECFDTAEKIAYESCKNNLPLTYIQKSSVFIRKGVLDEALKFAYKGLKLALEANEILTVMNSYYKLIDIYTSLGDFANLRSSYIKLVDILKGKEAYKGEVIKIYNKLALLYLEQNDIEMCKKYLQMAS